MHKPVQDSLEELRRAVKLQRLQERGATTQAASARSKIGVADRSAPLHLSWGQQRFWFLAQLDAAAGAAYHLPLGLRLTGTLDRVALGATLNRLVARHEVLRTCFEQHNGEPFQHIQPGDTGFTVVDHDLSALAPAAQADEVERIRAEEYEQAFDMASGPLCRGRLLRLNDQEYVLLITLHHIVSDAWSNGVLVREMSALYAAFCQQQPDPLPPLSLQYADYAQWQRSWLHGKALQAQLDYWTGHLRGAPHLLSLPTARPRPPAQSYHGSSMRVVIPAELSTRLRELTREHGATLFMTVLAAWTVLLARLSGQHDVVVGSPIANRQRSETESLIGFFVNTLALRVNMEDDPTVTELLARVRQTTLDAYQYQDLPFEQVVEAVNPPRSMGHSPIFQTSLNVGSVVEGEEMRLPGLEVSAIKQGIERTQCDLMLALTDQGSVISGSLTYASDLFDSATMERLCGHLETLLQSMIDNPERRVSQLDLLSVQERQQLIHGFNATATSNLPAVMLQHMFETSAAAHPQRSALRDALGTLSYGELNERANYLAHHLLTQGVKPDDRVALCATRGSQMVIGLLGILKAGAAYVPLDPAYPQQRLAFMLGDSAPKMLLTLDALADKLHPLCQQHGITVLLLDGAADAALLALQPRSNPVVAGLGTQQLAYLIYTSGSTGQPKGVMVEHGGLSNYLEWARGYYTAGQSGNSVVSSPFVFDATITSLYVPLISGGTVTLIAEGDELEGLEALLRQGNACGLIKITPAHLSVLGQRLRDDGVVCAAQTFVVGGEAFPAATARLWQQVAPQSRLVNEYGPTESVVGCSIYEFCANAVQGEQVPIGRPISNTQMYVLDALMQPVAPGVIGELYIGGAGVARGYLNRPDLSAERFVADPFSERPGARLYKTGDLGRLLADGNLDYLGRNDFQVKVHGFRIELGEIEACLAACAGVREAIVIAREDEPGDKRLVAYLLAEEGIAPGVAALRAQLEEQLAPYMVPSAFVMLDSFPLTSNGKLDRVALPVPGREALLEHTFEAPEGETETVLARIWRDLLKLERIGRADDFFALGGHSLLAVLLISRVRKSFGVDVPLKDVFGAPTLAGLAAIIARGASTVGDVIVVSDRSKALPLSWAQQRLWFLDQLDHAASIAYNSSTGLRLCGVLNEGALQATLDRIVARHESLRTRFMLAAGQPVQLIAPADIGFALARHDLSGLMMDQRASEVTRISTEEVNQAFDLGTGPLVRGRLLRITPEEHVLLLTLHHIVTDGWSTRLLVQELNALYAAFYAGQCDPLPPLAIQYADYAAWQRNWLQGDELKRQLGFWKAHLTDAPALLELPTDRPRPAVQSYAGASLPIRLNPATIAGLRALSHRHGTTLFMTILAAWTVLLARLSGQHDVVVGSPIANRQRSETESLIGFFVNTLALRVNMEDDPTVTELLARVRQTTLDAYQYQDLPFEQVVEAVNPPRSMGHSPIFQTSLNVGSVVEGEEMRLPGLEVNAIKQGIERTQCDLMLALTDQGSVISGSLTYASDLFDSATMERLCGHLETLLQSMIDNPERRVSQLDLLSVQERQQLIHGFNATATSNLPAVMLQHMFETSAAAHPQRSALRDALGTLSYGELNERANYLAHHLLTQGVKPDDRVALCATRGSQMVIGLLGILKAGAAYVPLDPAYPQQRLAFMLGDSAPKMLLTLDALADKLHPLCQQHGITVLLLDGAADAALLALQPRSNPVVAGLGTQQLAYLIYTSGSTGQPKGVMVEHGGLSNYLEWARGYYTAGQSGNSVVSSPFVFDATITSLYVPLISGGTVTLIAEGDELEGLEALLRQGNACGLIKITPAHLSVLGQRLRDDGVVCAAQTFVVGGEAFPAATARLWQQVAPQSRLVNEYGPTESVVGCSIYEFCANAVQGEQVPIGRPISNTQMYVLDALMQPVAPGVIGELYIGGAGVARGYLNRPDLSAERFVADPFSERPGARLYKTGDLGRLLADGNLDYLGRNDFQVKVHGFRIELGEIEACLAACAGVREAIVIAREDEPGDKRLVAYLLAEEGIAPGVAALRAQLEEQLAPYMVPSAFVMLDSFPLTSNGKLDRVALPVPGREALLEHTFEAPEGETETVLARIWRDLLKLERIGRADDFFALGGHSLLAVLLISRVRKSFGVDVPLKDVFGAPTLAGLAAIITRGASTVGDVIVVSDRSKALPLSWAQQRLWFLDQLDHAASIAYHMAAGFRLAGMLDRAALQATFDCIVARHESLRTNFVMHGNEVVQKIGAPEHGFSLQMHDLSALSGHKLQSAIDRIGTDEASAPFDLARGALIRGRLIRVSEQEHILLVTQHHIVSDGWSIGVLVSEVCTLYTAFSQGLPNPLPPLAIQYADYAQWQREWLQGDALQAQLGFWKTHLEGAPALLTMPTDRPRPPRQSFVGDNLPLRFDARLTMALRAMSTRHGTTLFMTLLAGWSILLARMSGQDDVVVGSPIANRQRSETEGLIGFFANTLALRVQLDQDPTVAAVLLQMKKSTLDAYAYQDLPFEQVVDALKPVRSMGYSPIFQTMLSLNNTPVGEALSLPGLTLSGIKRDTGTTQFDLSLSLLESGEGIVGGVDFATDLFDRSSIARLMDSWQMLLAAMVENDTQPVSTLRLLTDSAVHQTLNTWNRSDADFPLEQTYASLFAEQVALHPERIAVHCGNESISYRELDDRAARVVQVLLDSGVSSEQLVTLVCERDIVLLTMMLAVFKAGAAFLPLDVNHPAGRLREIMELSGSTVLLEAANCNALGDAMVAGLTSSPVRIVADKVWLAGPVPVLAARGKPDDLAYVIFTSGSTGKPKGTMVEQRGMLNHMFGKLMTMHVGMEDCLAQTASPAFDICIWQFLSAALVGGRCDIVPDVVAFDPARLIETVGSHGITLLQTVPSMMRSLLQVCTEQTDLHPLRWMVPTGEALPLAVAQDWFSRFPAIPLMNVYGPAECSDDVTYHALLQRPDDGTAIPIGRPTPNNRIYIVDRYLQLVPVGVVGEICVGGVGVGRGYLNNPEQTSSAFVPHPFEAGQRFYRTGDLGRYRADGVIEFAGRRDFQVKLRGFRIELGEIEAKLTACDGVRDAIVVAREDQPGVQRLVAYVLARDGAVPQAAALRAQLLRMLADYMVPGAFVLLDSFPLTPNGKIDRKALPTPDQSSLPAREYEAPMGDVELTLARIWKDILGVERVGRQDSFFELGGHSLLATQLVLRVRDGLAVELPLMKVFQTPTLAALSEEISTMKVGQFEADDVARVAAEMDEMSADDLRSWLDKN